jgi:hypothetical protein
MSCFFDRHLIVQGRKLPENHLFGDMLPKYHAGRRLVTCWASPSSPASWAITSSLGYTQRIGCESVSQEFGHGGFGCSAGYASGHTETAQRFLFALRSPRKPLDERAELCPGEFAFPRDTLVRFVRALDAIFGVAIARKHFNHFVDTPGRSSTDSRIKKHCIPNIEFVGWHRFPFSGGLTATEAVVS